VTAGAETRAETPTTGPLAAPPPPRSPWQLLYGGAHRLRRAWYRDRARRLPVPVISVGNLHWGGAGKTPLVAALAAYLRDRGLAACVLSRGYGRRGGGVAVVGAGAGPLLPPSRAGDEPVLLAGELPGVAVVVGADRHRAGRHALSRLEPRPEVFVLDDGFSHLALARDLDLLAFPAADPFAGGRLLPSGRLREPLEAAARADGVLLTGAAEGGPGGAELAAALRPHGFAGPGFSSATRTEPARRTDGRPLPPGARVVLAAGIARPERFFAAARAQGFEVARELALPDHHDYPPKTLRALAAALRETGAEALLTTTKDRVKLHGRTDLPLAELPVRAEPEPAFREWLDGRLAALDLGVEAAGNARGSGCGGDSESDRGSDGGDDRGSATDRRRDRGGDVDGDRRGERTARGDEAIRER
jgi:tetraacyldisaccharide 4'-kinase